MTGTREWTDCCWWTQLLPEAGEGQQLRGEREACSELGLASGVAPISPWVHLGLSEQSLGVEWESRVATMMLSKARPMELSEKTELILSANQPSSLTCPLPCPQGRSPEPTCHQSPGLPELPLSPGWVLCSSADCEHGLRPPSFSTPWGPWFALHPQIFGQLQQFFKISSALWGYHPHAGARLLSDDRVLFLRSPFCRVWAHPGLKYAPCTLWDLAGLTWVWGHPAPVPALFSSGRCAGRRQRCGELAPCPPPASAFVL